MAQNRFPEKRKKLPITPLIARIPTFWGVIQHIPMSRDVLQRLDEQRNTTQNLAERLATLTTGYTPDTAREAQETTYYDYPVLKQPFWRWEIIWYFFLGCIRLLKLNTMPSAVTKMQSCSRQIFAKVLYSTPVSSLNSREIW